MKYPKPLSSISGFHDSLILHFIEEMILDIPPGKSNIIPIYVLFAIFHIYFSKPDIF